MEVESVEPGSSVEQPDSSLLRQEANSSQSRQESMPSLGSNMGEAEKRRRVEDGATPNKRLKSEEADQI